MYVVCLYIYLGPLLFLSSGFCSFIIQILCIFKDLYLCTSSFVANINGIFKNVSFQFSITNIQNFFFFFKVRENETFLRGPVLYQAVPSVCFFLTTWLGIHELWIFFYFKEVVCHLLNYVLFLIFCLHFLNLYYWHLKFSYHFPQNFHDFIIFTPLYFKIFLSFDLS